MEKDRIVSKYYERNIKLEVLTITKLLDPKNDVVFQKLFGMKIH